MGLALEKLTEGQRRSISESLIQVTRHDSAKGELHGLCPIHGEENASFSYNYRTDVFHCFACEASGDLIELWSQVHGFGEKDGFKAFCEETGIETGQEARRPSGRRSGAEKAKKKNKPKDKVIPEADWEDLPPLPEKWIKRLEETRGWRREVIQALDLRFGRPEGGRENRIAIPVRDDQGRLLNIRLYLPGAKTKILSWWSGQGKTKTTYGQTRLWPHPSLWKDGPVWLCEGEPDVLCALSQGLNAVTQTAGAGTWKKEFNQAFKGRDVVIVYDNDQEGQRGGLKAAREISREAKLVRVLQWPEFMAKGQDLTDWFVMHGKTVEELQELVKETRRVEPAPDTEGKAGDGPLEKYFISNGKGGFTFKPALLAQDLLKSLDLVHDPASGQVFLWSERAGFWIETHRAQVLKAATEKLEDEASAHRAEDAVKQAVWLSSLPQGRTMNPDPDLICLRNGMFNIRTGEVLPHDKAHLATFQLPLEFDPRTPPDYPAWKEFLAQTVIKPGAIRDLRLFFGYCLLKEARYGAWLLLIGPGASGKSTALKVLRAMVGEENCSSVSLAGLQDQFQRALILNKMVNIGSEVEGPAFDTDLLKSIATGDPITAAFKHQDGFTFAPFCKLVFAANRWPKVRDNTTAFFRRILPIRFGRSFTPSEQDPRLLDSLLEELPGIFGWAWTGLVELMDQGGFRPSKHTLALLDEYRGTNSHVYTFAQECLVQDPEARVGKDEVYRNYQGWAEESGIKRPMSKNIFAQELREALPGLSDERPRIEGRRVMRWVGLRLALSTPNPLGV